MRITEMMALQDSQKGYGQPSDNAGIMGIFLNQIKEKQDEQRRQKNIEKQMSNAQKMMEQMANYEDKSLSGKGASILDGNSADLSRRGIIKNINYVPVKEMTMDENGNPSMKFGFRAANPAEQKNLMEMEQSKLDQAKSEELRQHALGYIQGTVPDSVMAEMIVKNGGKPEDLIELRGLRDSTRGQGNQVSNFQTAIPSSQVAGNVQGRQSVDPGFSSDIRDVSNDRGFTANIPGAMEIDHSRDGNGPFGSTLYSSPNADGKYVYNQRNIRTGKSNPGLTPDENGNYVYDQTNRGLDKSGQPKWKSQYGSEQEAWDAIYGRGRFDTNGTPAEPGDLARSMNGLPQTAERGDLARMFPGGTMQDAPRPPAQGTPIPTQAQQNGVPEGYRPTFKQDKFGNIVQGAPEAIPMTEVKAQRDMESEDKANTLKSQDAIKSAENAVASIDHLLSNINYFGPIEGRMPSGLNTGKREWVKNFDYLQAKNILGIISEMKSQSRTGATGFGAMNEKELALIERAAMKLDKQFDESTAKKYLDEMKAAFQTIINREKNGYQEVQGGQQQSQMGKTQTYNGKQYPVLVDENGREYIDVN